MGLWRISWLWPKIKKRLPILKSGWGAPFLFLTRRRWVYLKVAFCWWSYCLWQLNVWRWLLVICRWFSDMLKIVQHGVLSNVICSLVWIYFNNGQLSTVLDYLRQRQPSYQANCNCFQHWFFRHFGKHLHILCYHLGVSNHWRLCWIWCICL